MFTAARAIYHERGWTRFSYEEVARRSGVGKGSLYLRWPNKAALLVDAIRDEQPFTAAIDTGSLRGDLIEFATRYNSYVTSDEGDVVYRLLVESRLYPDLRECLVSSPYAQHIQDLRALIRRGLSRGELPEGTSIALVGDLVAGAVATHARATPENLRDRIETTIYLTTIVDTVLAGVTCRDSDRSDGR
ncbi:TetR/AcrR family transcriptional regulator [Rhodococcus opacus]|uniref:TetR/AcrR family transcriptional regulator n=1 Tax=Rhodococcus opacus TaxID=37919 RepID=UPI0029543DCC|nr:TetR/AcrR family transcriptional regulator [Rhodococcus opacus]MDV7089130.1 TetR/AcrR family transcriptional regulator [Rhodococcus opacus]